MSSLRTNENLESANVSPLWTPLDSLQLDFSATGDKPNEVSPVHKLLGPLDMATGGPKLKILVPVPSQASRLLKRLPIALCQILDHRRSWRVLDPIGLLVRFSSARISTVSAGQGILYRQRREAVPGWHEYAEAIAGTGGHFISI